MEVLKQYLVYTFNCVLFGAAARVGWKATDTVLNKIDQKRGSSDKVD